MMKLLYVFIIMMCIVSCTTNGKPTFSSGPAEEPKNLVVKTIANNTWITLNQDNKGIYRIPKAASRGVQIQLEASWPLTWVVQIDGTTLRQIRDEDKDEPGTFNALPEVTANKTTWKINIIPPIQSLDKDPFVVSLKNISMDKTKYPPGKPGHESTSISLNFSRKPPVTTVPSVIGLSYIEAEKRIEAARLLMGDVWNPTGEINSDLLVIKSQDPSSGSIVPEQTKVSMVEGLKSEHPEPKGVKQLLFFNCHSARRAISIWRHDLAGGPWVKSGNVPSQWPSSGGCPPPAASPLSVSLDNGKLYEIVAVAVGDISCDTEDPSLSACRRLSFQVKGDSNGDVKTVTVN